MEEWKELVYPYRFTIQIMTFYKFDTLDLAKRINSENDLFESLINPEYETKVSLKNEAHSIFVYSLKSRKRVDVDMVIDKYREILNGDEYYAKKLNLFQVKDIGTFKTLLFANNGVDKEFIKNCIIEDWNSK